MMSSWLLNNWVPQCSKNWYDQYVEDLRSSNSYLSLFYRSTRWNLSFISWIFETGPSNLENFLTCHYFLRFLIFPINAVLLSISPFFDVYIVTILGIVEPFRLPIVHIFKTKLERFDTTEIFELQHTSIYYSRSTVRGGLLHRWAEL